MLHGAWMQVTNMVQKRGSHVCTVVKNDMYAIGGWDAKDYLAGVEVYDVRKNAWRLAKPMTTTRAYGACASVDGSIYCLGGMLNHVRGIDLSPFCT
jgi:N-acetylneuraminic acid mutarotase